MWGQLHGPQRHRGSVATSLLLKVANFRERASGGGVDTVQKPSFYPEFMVLYFRFLLLSFFPKGTFTSHRIPRFFIRNWKEYITGTKLLWAHAILFIFLFIRLFGLLIIAYVKPREKKWTTHHDSQQSYFEHESVSTTPHLTTVRRFDQRHALVPNNWPVIFLPRYHYVAPPNTFGRDKNNPRLLKGLAASTWVWPPGEAGGS